MEYLRISPRGRVSANAVAAVVRQLERGRVAVLPTDTIYGLSCRADDARAIRRIIRLKRRDPKMGLIVLVDSLRTLRRYARIDSRQAVFLEKAWAARRRPTTVILRHRRLLPDVLSGGSDGLAVRLPKNVFLIKILKNLGVPLVSTSFNVSGRESIHDLSRLAEQFPGPEARPDLVVDAGVCRRRPSKLIDLRLSAMPVVLRK